MRPLLVATGNAGKLRELTALFERGGRQVVQVAGIFRDGEHHQRALRISVHQQDRESLLPRNAAHDCPTVIGVEANIGEQYRPRRTARIVEQAAIARAESLDEMIDRHGPPGRRPFGEVGEACAERGHEARGDDHRRATFQARLHFRDDSRIGRGSLGQQDRPGVGGIGRRQFDRDADIAEIIVQEVVAARLIRLVARHADRLAERPEHRIDCVER